MEQINYCTKKYPKPKDTYIIKEIQDQKGLRLSSPEKAYEMFKEAFKHLDSEREHFLSISVNIKNGLKSLDIISIGCLNQNIVHPREVYYPAVANRAYGIIVAHNHPSGDPSPSQEDINMTKKLEEAGKIIGIELYDHLIIGDNRFLSMKDQGLMI